MRKSRATKSSLFGKKQIRNRNQRLGHSALQIESLERRVVLDGTAIISEFLASNDRTLDDFDGDDSDWIEIYNPTNESVSLRKWALSDDPEDLTKWRFPDIELDAGQHLLVFASGKDRDNPEAELHTNFKLSSDGEYLALVASDGETVISEFNETYPAQITDVSFGTPIGIRDVVAIPSGQSVKTFVPTDNSIDQTEPDSVTGTWLDPAFDDSTWTNATTGIGFVPPTAIETLADSVAEFSGEQGQNNWSYGSWAKTGDNDGVYAPAEFTALNATAFFRADTNKWDVSVGGLPSLEISADSALPSGAGFITQAAIRRWTSETTGEVTIAGRLANSDAAGDGVTGRILVNGESIYEQQVDGNEQNFSLTANVEVGDLIDFMIDAGEANDEVGDLTVFTTTISGTPFVDVPTDIAADSVEDFGSNQGENGWSYGYYDLSADPDSTYQPSDLTLFPDEFWARSRWDWPAGNPPYTQVAKSSMQSNGTDAGPIHWAIRRWTSDIDGPATLNWSSAKSRTGGDGLVTRVLLNGSEIDSIQLAGDNRVGESHEIAINLNVGDQIDFAIDPTGIGGDPLNADGDDDAATVTATVTRRADPALHIDTDIGEQARNVGSSVYVRVPFNIDDPSVVDVFRMAVKFDDAYVAYLNGQPIAAENAPEEVGFDSVAVGERDPIEGTKFETVTSREALSLLTSGENVLQFHVMNSAVDDGDLLFDFHLTVGLRTIESQTQNYFEVPSPGTTNGLGATVLGPLVLDLDHSPNVPNADEPIVVTAEIVRTFADVNGAKLNYRVMYDDTATLDMVDDGTGDDAVAGDNVFTATIPANIASAGQMVRWFVTTNDTEGRATRMPTFRDPENSEEYRGTVINDPSIQSQLPVFHRFMESPRRADADTGTSGSFFYDGEFYDNVQMDLHGQSSRGFPTKSHDIDFPNDHRFRLNDDLRRIDDFNLLTLYADQSLMHNTLAWEQIKTIGSPHLLAFTVRVQLNGEFQALYDFVEDADWRMLERNGLNPDGSLYKMYNTFGSAAGNEKKNRKDEGNEDLDYIVKGVAGRLEDAEGNRNDAVDFILDNIDIPAMVNFVVGFAMTSDTDCCHKNYYAYQDTGGTDLWNLIHWDEDLTQGRKWGGFGRAYFDDTIYFDNPINQIGRNNTLIQKLYANVPGFDDMVNRRLRSVFDQYVKPPGTPYEQLPLETRVDELYEYMKDDAALHNAANPTNWGQSGFRDFRTASDMIKNDYSAKRREWLYTTQIQQDDTGTEAILSGDPGAQTVNYFVPTDNSLGTTWTDPEFNDAAWKSGPGGIGFEPDDDDDYQDEIRTNVFDDLSGSTSIFMRIPFNVDQVDDIEQMTLRMKYDDGYVAYLNGTEIARKNLRSVADDEVPPFDARARAHSDRLAADYDNVLVSSFIDQLKVGENVLAIHGINSSTTNDDFLMVPELVNGAIGNSRGIVPKAQVGNPNIEFGAVEFQPTSNNQNEEFIELVNNTDAAVDVSGWKLDGDVDVTFKGGTVIPAGFTMYVTADVNAFKARTEGPTGGMRLFTYANYEGRLPNGGGSVSLVASDGEIVNSTSYTGETTPVSDFLRVSEVNYNPLGPSAGERAQDITLDNEDFEFVELINTSGSETLSLDGVQFTDGVSFDFTGGAVSTLAPGERVLVVKDSAAFAIRYGADLMDRVAGTFAAGTGLSNGSDNLVLVDSTNTTIHDFRFDSQRSRGWPTRPDGDGSSLEVINFDGDFSEPSTWHASSKIHGTPGGAVSTPINGVVVNEVLSNPETPDADSIELHNPTNAAIQLDNFFLSDSANSIDSLANFAVPATTLGANGYVVYTAADFNAGDNRFGINSLGDDVFLTVGDENGPTHFADSVSFGAADAGTTFGRMTTGQNWFAPMSEPTLNAQNSDPKVGPVIISEFQYNPGAASAAALAANANLDGDDLEFVEIHNPQGEAVDLTAWRLRGGIDYNFTDGTLLGAGQTLVVVSFNPANPVNVTRTAAFRAQYQIGENVSLVGGYGNSLGNGGDRIALQRPGTPSDADPVTIPRIVVDEVIFDDSAAWPVEADGTGQSLNRSSRNGFGLDSGSWLSNAATPGTTSFVGGDLDGNGTIDEADIQVVCSAMQTGNLELDFDGSGTVNQADLRFFVIGVLGSTIGDSNLDGKFDSGDLTQVFQTAEYEDNIAGNSTWGDGDWNCDGEFSSRDLVAAFMVGDYVAASVATVEIADIAAAIQQLPSVDQLNDSGEGKARIALPHRSSRNVDFAPAEVDAVFDLDRSIRDDSAKSDSDENTLESGDSAFIA